MDEELNYAEMLEIPVETVTVNRKERKHSKEAAEEEGEGLQQQLVEQVNDRVNEEESDPAYAESTPIEREAKPVKAKRNWVKRLLLGEFVAVCALCATIFLTNIFMTNSAMNTFVRGLFNGKASTADARTYSDFTLTSVVNDYTDAEITVSNTGVMSFTAKCSVYPPCEGTVASINGNENTGYTISLKHSDSFSSIISGIDTVFCAEGDKVKSNIPIAYTKGESSVHVMFYSGDNLLNCYSVGEGGIAWN
ncbi:MAG: M23 family metallopeptidase [Clostridia bacterium]|nr:M23 family metallopeptidase [Clostridia bacterium]